MHRFPLKCRFGHHTGGQDGAMRDRYATPHNPMKSPPLRLLTFILLAAGVSAPAASK